MGLEVEVKVEIEVKAEEVGDDRVPVLEVAGVLEVVGVYVNY